MQKPSPAVKVTYYLEVISSWCHWAEPTWAELKRRYAGRVAFDWKIAQMPPEAYPVSRDQCEWFYRRSGSMVRSPYMLNSGWLEASIKDYLVPNLVAEAARALGAKGDQVRIAIAEAAVLEGKKVGRWDVCVAVAAKAGRLNKGKLMARAKSKAVADVVRKSSAEFDSFQVNQRPTFLIEDNIGDRAVLSGLVRIEPLMATIETMLADAQAYASWKAHVGEAPTT